jgi:hypothetical protein
MRLGRRKTEPGARWSQLRPLAQSPKTQHGWAPGPARACSYPEKGGTQDECENVKTLRAAHESWNKRDFAGVVSNAVEDLA